MRFFPLFISLLLISSALAHEEVEEKTLDHKLRDNSVFLISYGSLAILLSIGISFFIHSRHHHWPYFLVAAITILITSYLVIATINLNLVSETKGPVHWHADFEIYNCGEKLDLIDPKGLSNKIGTPVFHEHNDDRMHVEGVVVEEEHVSLSEFIETIGGELTADSMKIETNDGVVVMNNGDICGGEESQLNVFLYRVTNPDPTKKSGFIYEKRRLDDFTGYVLSPYFNVPPGDCIIIEFGPYMQSTDKMCETYRLAVSKGELNGG